MIKEAFELHLEGMSDAEVDALDQRIEDEPRIYRMAVNAPSLLRTRA